MTLSNLAAKVMQMREDQPNANRKLTDEERLSAIKYHPSIRPSRAALERT